ncbi:hypothetical protein EDB82DRAFT_141185 [Fusarium venenatum]|uniref:uncharacterized protein n=1 Tax=Fusarium venenatum TaxID=56646 RepID=UPI001D3020E6|nr:hypothetical protein EDB82DRAFT_141185 [Fusarium venenatum]
MQLFPLVWFTVLQSCRDTRSICLTEPSFGSPNCYAWQRVMVTGDFGSYCLTLSACKSPWRVTNRTPLLVSTATVRLNGLGRGGKFINPMGWLAQGQKGWQRCRDGRVRDYIVVGYSCVAVAA